MTYSDLYKKRGIKIPSILAVVVVAALSFFASGFVLEQPISTQATKKNVISLEATSIGSNKATIVWRTSQKENGAVLYGTDPEKTSTVALDQRDSTNQKSEFFNHSVLLSALNPNTTYYYRLTNNKELFEFGNQTVFKFTTSQVDNRINSLKPAYGTVVSDGGKPEQDVLVVISNSNIVTQSTLSKESGEWLIPLNSLLSKESQTLFTPSSAETLTITFYDEKGNTSVVSSPIQLVSPIADPVKMGQNYSLPEDLTVLSASTSSARLTTVSPIPTSSSTGTSQAGQRGVGGFSTAFSLQYPVNNSTIPVGNPLIKGKAPAQSTVTTIINGNGQFITRTSQADAKGDWKLTLTSALPAGKYTLTSQVTMPSVSERQQRTFTITKSGQQVLGEATGSAQLTSTPTPTTSQATPSPTKKVTPTSTPRVIEAEPTDVTPTLPATGGTVTYLLYSSAALIIFGLGLLFLF